MAQKPFVLKIRDDHKIIKTLKIPKQNKQVEDKRSSILNRYKKALKLYQKAISRSIFIV